MLIYKQTHKEAAENTQQQKKKGNGEKRRVLVDVVVKMGEKLREEYKDAANRCEEEGEGGRETSKVWSWKRRRKRRCIHGGSPLHPSSSEN